MEQQSITKEQIVAYQAARLQLAAQILREAVERISQECEVDFVPYAQIVNGRIVADVELRVRL